MELDKNKVYDALYELIDDIDYDLFKHLLMGEDGDGPDQFPELADKFIQYYRLA